MYLEIDYQKMMFTGKLTVVYSNDRKNLTMKTTVYYCMLLCCRCKLFYQKEGAWTEKGVGFLHLKKNDDIAQLLVRADTSLGTQTFLDSLTKGFSSKINIPFYAGTLNIDSPKQKQ